MRFKWAIRRISVLFITFFLFSYLIFSNFFQQEETIDYPDDFDPVKNEIFVKNYLELMQKQQAPVRPIIEKMSKVEENFWCFLKKPKKVQKSRKNWIKMAGIEVFSAYYDDRDNSLFPENSAVQVLVMSNHSIEGKIPIFCNIFTSSSSSFLEFEKSATVKGYIREIWQTGWDPRDTFQVPSLITCPIPKRIDKNQKMIVNLSRRRCYSGDEAVEVVGKSDDVEKKKEDVAVCVKGLDYQEDISERFLEWIEMQYLLGADTVSIYHFHLTPETLKVLEYYKTHKKSKFKVTPLKLPSGNSNNPIERSKYLKSNRPAKRRHELLPYNDCFYDHIHTHRYVLIIDIDEIIVPIQYFNYSSLLDNFEKRNNQKTFQLSSISSRNVFKFPSNFTLFKKRYYMISNTKRSRKTSPNGEFGKSFSSTSTVATVFNHFALHKLHPNVMKSKYFLESEAIKLHYKSECPWESRNECHQLEYDVVEDFSLDRFHVELRKRVDDVAMKIGME